MFRYKKFYEALREGWVANTIDTISSSMSLDLVSLLLSIPPKLLFSQVVLKAAKINIMNILCRIALSMPIMSPHS